MLFTAAVFLDVASRMMRAYICELCRAPPCCFVLQIPKTEMVGFEGL